MIVAHIVKDLRAASGNLTARQQRATGVTPSLLRAAADELERLERAMDAKVTKGLDAILEAAESHGAASDPEHEIGDLQEAVRLAWSLLSPFAKSKLVALYFEGPGEGWGGR